MSHTEGPWKVVHYEWRDKGGGDFVGCIEGANGEKVYKGAGSFHAINNLSDVTLMAAAPALLDVLRDVLARVIGTEGEEALEIFIAMGRGRLGVYLTPIQLIAIKEAIAIATGDEND